METNFEAILKQYWGYETFRGVQLPIIRSIAQGRDTLGLMPTGGGKSLTFQVPTMAREGLCLVITPLIALMKDQVANLRRKGILATAIYSGMTRNEVLVALENCVFGPYKFLYVSPERLATELFISKLKAMNISLIAVDESHCISQWGYDFRPAYLDIAKIREIHPEVPILALTATATPEVVKDIQVRLAFREENVFQMSFERKNLAYVVRKCSDRYDKESELLHILRHTEGSCIIYTRSRQGTYDIAKRICGEGISAEFFHAGLTNVKKDKLQKAFFAGDFRVIVATNAFGMGIDKSDVRLVVHVDVPDSIEAYFQEAGRAGRDGQKAYSVLLTMEQDRLTLNRRISTTYPEREYIAQVYEKLCYYLQIAMDAGEGRMLEFDLAEFCRNFKLFPTVCESALKLLTQAGYIDYVEEQENTSRLHFSMMRDELYRQPISHVPTDRLLQLLLRRYTGLFSEFVYVKEAELAARLDFTTHEVYQLLLGLSQRGIIDYIPAKRTAFIFFKRDRVDLKYLSIPRSLYEERIERMKVRIGAMDHYITEEEQCRSKMLLGYFGEKEVPNCGQCDVCLAQRKLQPLNKAEQTVEDIAQQILELLGEQKIPLREFYTLWENRKEASMVDRETFFTALRFLISEERVSVTNWELSRN